MQHLRNARHLARLVLAWFVLSLGVAVASPLVKPQNVQMVCSGSGVMVVAASDDGSTGPSTRTTLDCPLCAGLSAPPPPVVAAVVTPLQPLSYAPAGISSAHTAARAAAPLPARGPPTL